jgi:hypothetical protein
MTDQVTVVGGGLFGCWAALVLARKGKSVTVVEQDETLLGRASWVNQARLHTGLHYPRSLLTAREALSSYRRFRDEFPEAVHDFAQVYAIARHGSKTSAAGFESFIERLGLRADPVAVDTWFSPTMVEAAWAVEEPTFDTVQLRANLLARIRAEPRITVRSGVGVTSATATGAGVRVGLRDGTVVDADELVIATYAGINGLRDELGLDRLPLLHELTEVVLGTVDERLTGRGFTMMDGPFWSLMPFGDTGKVSLTSVGLTPVVRSGAVPTFSCQQMRQGCDPLTPADCNLCPVRPVSLAEHQQQQMSLFLKDSGSFKATGSIWTIKTVLQIAEVDDARPTVVRRETDLPVWTVFSGKVSTVFDLEEALT